MDRLLIINVEVHGKFLRIPFKERLSYGIHIKRQTNKLTKVMEWAASKYC